MTRPRRRLRKVLKVAAAVLAALVVGLAVAGVYFVRRPWPQVDGTLAVAGLEAPVEVVRDRWGVPHVFAEDERDLFFAQGYVHAQDRLWQMEFNRLAASGRLGTLLGEALLDADRYLRTLGLRRAAERDWAAIDEETREVLEAYAAGVNAFVDANRGRLPLEFTLLGHDPAPWTPVDSLAWGRLMGLTLSLNHPMEVLRARLAAKLGEDSLRQLLPPYPADAPVIVPAAAGAGERHPVLAAVLGPAGSVWGSNSWIVHGSRTAGGRPILANDTHLGLGMPSPYYENGLHGGRFDAVGFSFAGMPLVVIGHNARVAWGITNMCSDVQDFYVERLDDPESPARYEYQGEWHDLEVVVERIELKGAEPVEHRVLSTRHGPLVNDVMDEIDAAEPLALRWSTMEEGSAGGRLFDGLVGLNLADGWEAFQAALSLWDSLSLNVSYADVDGNIGYQGTGQVPIRAPGHDGVVPVPGWTDEYEWQGFIPFAEMPRSFNPESGFIVTANNKVVGDDYPYHLAHDMADRYRAERMAAVLAASDRHTMEDMRALHADVRALPAAELRPHLLAVEPESDQERRALEAVAAWDLEFTADSPGATVYEAWYWRLWPNVLGDELGEELMTFYMSRAISQVPVMLDLFSRDDAPFFDDARTPEVETRHDVVRRTFAQAVAWLSERYGEDPAGWTWGRVHTVTFAHVPLGQSGIGLLERIFNGKTLPLAGDVFTVNSSMHDLADPYAVSFGVAQRLLVDLGDLDRSLAVNSTGQVAHAFHPHREDQVPLWAAVDYHPLPATREAATAMAEATLRLTPPP